MRHTDSQLVSGHNIDSGHKIAAGGPTHTGTPAVAGRDTTDETAARTRFTQLAARSSPFHLQETYRCPKSSRLHFVPSSPPPATTKLAAPRGTGPVHHARADAESVSPTNPDERHGRTRASSAGLRPPGPAPAVFLCPCSPERGALLWRTVSTAAEEWIPLIETPELMSTPAVINRTREEGIIIIIRRGECRSAVCSERMPDAERTQHRNQCQELVSEFLSMTVSL